MLTQSRIENREGPIGRALDQNAANLPSDLFMCAAGASILASLALKMAKRDSEALFVGQWAPTFLLLGVFNKIVKTLGERRRELGSVE